MMNPLSPEEILISIHPDYKRCAECNRYFHFEKNKNIHIRIFLITPIRKCVVCYCVHHPYIHERLQSLGVTNTELESIYGDLYAIKYSYHHNRFAFNKINPL